ncbi:ABC transporter ATP-binding protein [Thiosulfatihalobacter marinus]|uniref:ABC transporter ATP-binding protein n=1 Tax=Thiosulfatihalobacter marinus TaxID=2792481 RepID=UPI0018D79D61|nr:ABC transporter ATP-binding protein [Thiosulfatihalobacter marinus]
MTRVLTAEAGAFSVEAVGMTMDFGGFRALDNVTINVNAGSFHALLGENGAGKSTLVKCIMGFYHATSGGVLVAGCEQAITDPKVAHGLGLGMVYQHFTLVPSLTGAENLVINRADAPRVINWAKERAALAEFMAGMPFSVPLDLPVSRLAAGEKQKLEILKQLYLGRRFLILDEPTSVLTPDEASEVLGHVRALTEAGEISVLMITHKFREVTQFADEVTVLRRGSVSGSGPVRDLSAEDMARMMMGKAPEQTQTARTGTPGAAVLELDAVRAADRSGLKTIEIDSLAVHGGEILGIAGVSGNGQVELMEILTGQRPVSGGVVRIKGAPYLATRAEAKAHKVRYLPEEPLRNACAPKMSVAENLAFRLFDEGPGHRPRFWKSGRQIAANADRLIARFNVKAASADAPIAALSGGNVQRAVLARELSGDVELLIVSNPCFGLDFSAVSAIRARIVEARNRGVAVLLISEDLDETLELADRILVMSEGRIAFEAPAARADVAEIGRHMAGHA